MVSANQRATEVARSSYSRLLALLAARTGDIMAAEDALADAFRKALESWPAKGIPSNPEGWLMTVSKNALRDEFRSARHRTNVALDGEEGLQQAMTEIDPDAIPDDRLKLLFVCAHPAIAETVRTPLMLQTVLGLEAEAISTAFLIPAVAMAQRLVRAKRKIREARIPFALPEKRDMPERLESVLEAIYGAYVIDWDSAKPGNGEEDLATEALYLADLLVTLLPEQAEVLGLAALLSFSIARKPARLSSDGAFIPLEKQDTQAWDRLRIARARALLQRAQQLGQVGRFQIEAAIQDVHCDRARVGDTDWLALSQLYEALVRLAPTVGAAVSRAAVIGKAHGAQAGLDCLAQLNPELTESYQPAWATRAFLLEQHGDRAGATKSYQRAISLTTGMATRRYLKNCLLGLSGD